MYWYSILKLLKDFIVSIQYLFESLIKLDLIWKQKEYKLNNRIYKKLIKWKFDF